MVFKEVIIGKPLSENEYENEVQKFRDEHKRGTDGFIYDEYKYKDFTLFSYVQENVRTIEYRYAIITKNGTKYNINYSPIFDEEFYLNEEESKIYYKYPSTSSPNDFTYVELDIHTSNTSFVNYIPSNSKSLFDSKYFVNSNATSE